MKYGDKKYAKNMSQDKFNNLIVEFFNIHENEINNILITKNDDKLIKTIISTYRKSLKKLLTKII